MPDPKTDGNTVFLPLIPSSGTEPPPLPQRVATDPITRIEGHLRLEVQIENGQVTDAWSAGVSCFKRGSQDRIDHRL